MSPEKTKLKDLNSIKWLLWEKKRQDMTKFYDKITYNNEIFLKNKVTTQQEAQRVTIVYLSTFFRIEHVQMMVYPKTQTRWRILSTGYLPPVKFPSIQINGCREEFKNDSVNQMLGGYLGFPIGP